MAESAPNSTQPNATAGIGTAPPAQSLDSAALFVSTVVAFVVLLGVTWLWWYGILRRWKAGYLELQPTPTRGGPGTSYHQSSTGAGSYQGTGGAGAAAPASARRLVGRTPALDGEYGCTLDDV